MSKMMNVTYYHHSGFAVSSGDVLLVFDYWRGMGGKFPEILGITPETLARYNQVYVFITHEHEDHYDGLVYTWDQYAPVTYVIADTLPEKARGHRMSKGGELTLSDRVHVKAYGSTDAGVSFLVTLDGMKFFHAGDLNFWHWREVSNARQIQEADEDFKAEVKDLQGEDIDVAFFPVDPRMGMLFDAGANYFTLTVKPRLLLPMHFWGRSDVIVEFARRSRTRETEIVALTTPGQGISLDIEDDGFMNISLMAAPNLSQLSHGSGEVVSLAGLEGEDPFYETDMPIDM
jgi:L-ascorbate metabolism protein UlaG (beta-lactamase superfamily)